jgi:hypothetical protein
MVEQLLGLLYVFSEKNNTRGTGPLIGVGGECGKFKGTVWWDFLLQVFSSIIFPQAPVIGSFWIFSIIYRDIRKSRWPLKLFWLKIFSNCLQCQWYTGGVPWAQIFPRIFKKIGNAPKGNLRSLEEECEKIWSRKSRDTVPSIRTIALCCWDPSV